MSDQDRRDRELEALQQRLTQLSEASLRINESLEFDTVLQGVLDSARKLTSARYGVMTLLDEGGQVADFLSSGTTAAEAERLWLTSDSQRIFESLTEISGPLRVADLAEHVRSLGFDGVRDSCAGGGVQLSGGADAVPGRPVGPSVRGRQGWRRGVHPRR